MWCIRTGAAFCCLAFAFVLDGVTSTESNPDYSWAHPRTDWPGWWGVHQRYLNDSQGAKESGKGIELLFWGDSITQCWRFGERDPQLVEPPAAAGAAPPPTDGPPCEGAPAVWQERFGSRYNAQVFGIGGDQTPEMMYRLLHGEGPQGLGTRVGVLLIGTNDLGYSPDKSEQAILAKAPEAAAHIEAIADYVTGLGVQLVLMGVLQRGDWHQPPEVRYKQPSVFTPAVDLINRRVRRHASANPLAHYVDCSALYLADNGTRIDRDLMPDSLHPSKAGFELMAGCLGPLVARLMGVQQLAQAAAATA